MDQQVQPSPRAVDDASRDATSLQSIESHVHCALDRVVLTVIRLLFGSYATENARYCHAALCAADNALGPVDGPALLGRCSAIASAIRQDRERGFRFLPAACEHISPHEIEFLGILEATRSNDRALMETAARAFTGTERPARLVIAATALVETLDRLSVGTHGRFRGNTGHRATRH
jgi:hypothetical protein